MRITDIKPNPNNPRIIKDDKFKKLVKSIKDFPQMLELRPIVIDENNVVLGGNMRLKACIEAGLTDVPSLKSTLSKNFRLLFCKCKRRHDRDNQRRRDRITQRAAG